MRFVIAKAANKTGSILERLVIEGLLAQGISAPDNATVCYGAGVATAGGPCLNQRCSLLDKMEQGQRLSEVLGENALPVYKADRITSPVFDDGPWLARRRKHSRGTDIMPVLESWQILARITAGADFFTPYIPSEREYRVWVYRNRHLGTYEKVLTEPRLFTRLGRNRANGFTFSYRESGSVPEALKNIARQAVAALSLDFGAVDILQARENTYKVLEVNSAPGVSDEHRRVIQRLARRVVRWAANGCPERTHGN